MGQRFIACDREQSFLLPPDVREWLPPGHLAWFVVDALPSDATTDEPDDLWRDVLRRQPDPVRLFANYPPDLSVN